MGTLTIRLSGAAGRVDAMLDVVRGSPGVDRVVEMGAADMPRQSDDSSSAGLPDDTVSGSRDVEVHAVGDTATRDVRNRIEAAGNAAGIVVEWLQPF